MSPYETVALYLITLTVFLAIDMTWLGYVAKDYYRSALKKFLPKQFDFRKALLFYAIYIVGVLIMVLVPAINQESLGIAMFRGFGFGFFTYATYDLTNWATIDKWPIKISILDMAWGAFLGWSVSTISYSMFIAIFN